MDIKELLHQAGFSPGEITIYLSLLNSGASTASQVHERVGIERRNVYDILTKLIERGFVSYIDENKHRTFRISDPKRIVTYLQEREAEYESLRASADQLLPQLVAQADTKRSEIAAQVYRGLDGMKTVWNDMLNYTEIRWLGSGNYMPDTYPTFFDQWTRRRIEAGVKSYHLFRHEAKGKVKPKEQQFGKFLPVGFSGNPVVTVIYGDKTAQLMFGKELFAIVVQSAELAQNYRKHHDYLWKNVAR